MWWGSGGVEPVEEEEDLPDLRVQFQEQENLLGQLKGALKSNEAKLQNKEKQVKDIASRLSKSKLEERAKEAAAKQTERQWIAQTTGALPKVIIPPTTCTTKKGSKIARLRAELQDAREKEAEMVDGQRSLENKVAALQKELAERDDIIRDYDLASMTGDESLIGSPLSSSPYVMSPERGQSPSSNSPPIGSSFEDVFNYSSKSHVIVELNEKILDYERRIMDLEEDLRNKDEVIRARTEAVSAVSEQMSQKGRSVIDELEETRTEMRKMQTQFTESEMEWTKKNMKLQVDNDSLTQNLELNKENEARAEQVRFNLSTKNASLQEKIVKLQSDINEKRALDNQREIEFLDLQAELDECQEKLKSNKKSVQDGIDQFYEKISDIFERNEDVDAELGSTIKCLQSKLIELEEEKGNLQLKLIDYEDESGINLKAEVQKLKESLRVKDEVLGELQENVDEKRNEFQECNKELEKKELELSSFADQVSRLVQNNEEMARSKVAIEMRALELEEIKETLESELKESKVQMAEVNINIKEPFEKLKQDYKNCQESLQSLEKTHSEYKGRQLQNDKELLEKSKQIKEHVIEIAQLEKVLQSKTAEISDELAKSDLLEKELVSLKKSLEEANLEIKEKEKEIQEFKASDMQEKITVMSQELESLNSDIAKKKEKVSGYELEVEDLHSKLKKKDVEINELTEKFDNVNEEKKLLREKSDGLLKELKESEIEKAKLSSDIESCTDECDLKLNELRLKIQELNQEKESILSKLTQIEEELTKSRDDAEKEIETLNDTLNEKNKMIKSLNETSESFKMELEALTEKHSIILNENENCAIKIDSLNSQLFDHQNIISELNLKINSHEQEINVSKKAEVEFEQAQKLEKYGEIESLKLELENQSKDFNNQIFNLESENTSLKNSFESIKKEKNEIEILHKKFSLELTSLNSHIDQLQKEKGELLDSLNTNMDSSVANNKDGAYKSLEDSIEDLKAYKDSIKSELSDKVSEIKGLKDIINELQTMISELKADIKDKSIKIAHFEEEHQSYISKKDVAVDKENVDKSESRISELESYIEIKNSELETQLSIQSDMDSKITELEKDLSNKAAEIIKLVSHINILESSKGLSSSQTLELEEKCKELKCLKDDFDEKTKEASTLQDKLDSANVKLRSLEGSYNNLLEGKENGNVIGERDKFKMKNEQLLDKAKKATHSLDGFNKEKGELVEKWQIEKSEKDVLIQQNNTLNEKSKELERNYEEVKDKYEVIKGEKDSMQVEIADLQRSVENMNVSSQTQNQAECQELKAKISKAENEIIKFLLSLIKKLRNFGLKKNKYPPSHEEPLKQEEEETGGWDEGFSFDDPIESQVVEKEAIKVSQNVAAEVVVSSSKEGTSALAATKVDHDDGWGNDDDDDWGAWDGEEQNVESSKLEKDSKEQEKDSSSNVHQLELKVQELTQELQKQNNKLDVERSKFSEEEEAFYEKIETLEKDLSEKDKEFKKLKSSFDDLEIKIVNYKKMNNEQELEIKSYTENMKNEVDEEMKTLMNESKEQKERIGTLQHQLSDLSQEKENLETELSSLRFEISTKNEDFSKSVAEKESLNSNIRDLNTHLTDIRLELESKNKELFDSNNFLQIEVEKSESMTKHYESLNQQSNELSAEIECLKANLSEKSNEEQNIRLELDSLRSNYEILQNANIMNDKEKIHQMQNDLERIRVESINMETTKIELDRNRIEICNLTNERDTLVQQVNEMNMRLEGQRSTEEGLHLQLSGLTTDLRGFEQREAELNHIISQMKESSAQEIESFSTQNNVLSEKIESIKNEMTENDGRLKDASDTVESLRHENECLNTRCSQLVTELESKYMECANLTQQLETIITQQQNETVSAFAPPPDVTQYQQQPDVALHSIPQPDIMPSGYVDLVQQPSSSSSLYPDPLQSSQNLDGANFFDPSLPVSSNNQHQPLPSSSYPPIDNQHIHSIQEVQTELTLADIDNLIMLESLNHQFLDLQNEISLLRDENMTLHATLSQNQKDSEESVSKIREELFSKESELNILKNEKNASAEIVPSTSLDNVNSEVLSSHVDSVAPVEQSIMATSIQQENNNNSLTLEWYKEQFTTYQTAINNWQEWGRVKTEELDGYVNAYNEVSNELLDARSAIEVKMVEMSQLSQIVEQLTNEIQEMRRKDELVKEKKSYNAESWRSKLRAKEIEIQDLTETVERLKSEKEELMEEVNELREKNESLRSDRVFSEELEDLKFQLDEIVEEKRTQSLEMESIMKKYQTISSNEDNLNKINQKLQADIDASNKIVRKLESDIKANENEIKDREAIAENAKLTLKNQVDELQKENQNLELSIDSYKRQIEKLQKDLENEKFNNSTLFNEKLSEIESCKSEMGALKDELNTVKSTLDTANTAIVEWSSWGQTKITEYDTLLKSYEEYVAAYNSINSELSLLKEAANTTQESSAKIRENIEILESGQDEEGLSTNSKLIEDLKTQLSLSLSESDKLKEEIQNVRLRNGKLTMRSKQMEKELEAIKAGGSSSADDMTELRAANFELNKNASSLQIELSQSSKSLEELNNERINLSERVIDLENRIDILNYDNEVLKNVRTDFDSLKMKYDSLVSEKLTCETQSMPESLQPENSFSHNEKLLIAQLESELQQKSDSLQNLEFELSRLRVLGDTERLELDKSLRENRQLNSQMNYWKQQIYTEQQIPGSNSTQNELHCARQAASAFQVQVEQLTTELTKLQEERDTLQLKLSNVMRQYERQRESSSRASTACSTPIPWVDPSLVEIKELKSKIEELGNLNYALDIELQKERQTRENMQARLRHPSSSSSSSTPVHLPHKPTTSDLSSLSGGQVLHL
ncbi:uncharacterized protein [Lepeophtheirus salmonis]|uniref:uncharacterized protein n=1 Tax=Lepeophtheirus salmonis TaxID=72036 RepID=UPI001AE8EFDE|nr:uncharacterized protein PFB0145c-like [Lepeophtheirus salmonis]